MKEDSGIDESSSLWKKETPLVSLPDCMSTCSEVWETDEGERKGGENEVDVCELGVELRRGGADDVVEGALEWKNEELNEWHVGVTLF